MKRIAFAVFMLAALMQAAVAADASRIVWAGLSPDGRYFAFEESGGNEAGDYAYTQVIDVARNQDVKGSPLGWGPDDGDDGTRKRRATAQAKVLLQKTNISREAVMTAAVPQALPRIEVNHLELTEHANRARKSFALPDNWLGPDARLVLSEFDVAGRDCSEQVRGFRLVLERKGKSPLPFKHDQSFPRYHCPFKYGIAEVNALRLHDGFVALAVMIQWFRPGFEGAPDRRIEVVTALIPSQTRPE